ncbi:MAG: M20/M25/M40 family metallo-hydrolase, partial [Anaerolineae bacterium]|nr:M20/M25/M40 family metallo-hydrolase [Anaerolineae bacterium]
DKDGIRLEDALANFDVSLDMALEAHQQLRTAKAYLELHIEQGPVLESMGLPLGVVLGTVGVERHGIRFTGQAAHSGSTPMDKRKDALGGVSKLHLEIREIAKRHHGVCTVGRVETKPGIVTSVVADAYMTLDQRHLDPAELAAMLQEAKDYSEQVAKDEHIGVEWSKLWQIQPLPFDPQLIEFCEQAILETAGVSHRLPSGPLHDAAEMVRAGVPTIMIFVQSLYGISHNKIEDTKE